jgi:hypothetical protein
VVKLWRPGRDIATFALPVAHGTAYHLKVVTRGTTIKVYLDDRPTPVIDATDGQYPSGRFGLNVYASTAVFQDVRLS